MRLLLVELTRFRSRRAIALMLVATALLTAVIAATTVWGTRPVSADDLAAAEAKARAELELPHIQEQIEECEQDPESWMGPGATPEECAATMTPQADWFLDRSQLSLEQEVEDSGIAVLVISSALMIIVGTTFAGADWASGSMSNQLLFEPRRGRVWLAKAGAVFLGALVVVAVIVAAFWVTLFLVAQARDLATSAEVREQIAWTAVRGTMLAAVAATGGYALTMLLRHTVGSLAVLFAYAVGGEILIASLPFEGVQRWSLSTNVFAWIQDGYEYYDPSISCSPTEDLCDQTAMLALADAGPYLGTLLVLVVVLSVVLFRRRDVP